MQQKSLIKSVSQELIEPTLDVAQDYAELGIEELIDSPIIEHVPIVKAVVALCKTGIAIRERHFVKKLLAFLHEFQSGGCQTPRAAEFRKRLQSDETFRNKVVEHLLVIIDRFVTVEKANILGHLFRAHVDGLFDWDGFMGASIALDLLQPDGITVLYALAPVEGKPVKEPAPDMEALLLGGGIASRHGTSFKISATGIRLYRYGIAPSIQERINARNSRRTNGSEL